MATLHLEILTPENRVYSEEVNSVTFPEAEMGEVSILPGHIPLMTMTVPGELKVRKGSETIELAVGEGFVEVTGDRVTVLTDMAIKFEQIDEEQVEAALARAQKALAEKPASKAEVEALEGLIEKSIAQLNLKRKPKR